MEETQKENHQKGKESENKQSLQSDDREVLENRNPKEGSEPISNAGKKRDDEKRYQ